MSSESSPHRASQSSQGDGHGNSTGTSYRDHGGGGGASLCDKLTVKDGRSIKAPIADRGLSSLLKSELIPRFHGMSNS